MGERDYKRVQENLGVMDILMILTVVMVSHYTYIKSYQTIYTGTFEICSICCMSMIYPI